MNLNHIKTMKKFLTLIAALALLACAFTCPAADVRYTFSGTGTAISTTNSHLIIPATGVGDAVVVAVDATAYPAATFTFSRGGTRTMLTAATAASPGTNLTCVGSAFTAGDIVVLQHVSADTYERLVVSTASATNVTTTAAITTAAAAGDVLWLMSAAGTLSSITNSSGTRVTAEAGVFSANRGLPALFTLTGTNTPTINTVNVKYLPR